MLLWSGRDTSACGFGYFGERERREGGEVGGVEKPRHDVMLPSIQARLGRPHVVLLRK